MTRVFAFHHPAGRLESIRHQRQHFELWGWNDARDGLPSSTGTHYGAVAEGRPILACSSGVFELREGMAFCVPGALEIRGPGKVFGITASDYVGMFQLVGPTEPTGRLRYIDGCTDSVLVPPPVRGEPCLNHLHFPPGTDQTEHTHPSFRAGLVLRGRGVCKLTDGDLALLPGTIFHLPPHLRHGFRTGERSMDVIAFHPDSDCGPIHDDHPMVNRTMVDGVSAKEIARIRT